MRAELSFHNGGGRTSRRALVAASFGKRREIELWMVRSRNVASALIENAFFLDRFDREYLTRKRLPAQEPSRTPSERPHSLRNRPLQSRMPLLEFREHILEFRKPSLDSREHILKSREHILDPRKPSLKLREHILKSREHILKPRKPSLRSRMPSLNRKMPSLQPRMCSLQPIQRLKRLFLLFV